MIDTRLPKLYRGLPQKGWTSVPNWSSFTCIRKGCERWFDFLDTKPPRINNYYFERNTERARRRTGIGQTTLWIRPGVRHCGQHYDNKHSFHFAERAP